MGNLQNKENVNLANELDYIAANYIINNKEDIDLTKDKDCEQLVEKITDLLKTNLNGLQSNYLIKKRIKYNNTENNDANNNDEKCKDISNIASFYVKIANIFAAITTSVYKDTSSSSISPISEKTKPVKEYPTEEEIKGIKKYTNKYFGNPYNFCSERLKNLINDQNYKDLDLTKSSNSSNFFPSIYGNGDYDKTEIIVKPNICNMNKDIKDVKDVKDKNNKNEIKNLSLEPGIIELRKLYNDVYDVKQDDFVSMSENMKKMYKRDVKTFYNALYGDENTFFPDDNINYFSDISLNDYTKGKGCNEHGIYTKEYKGLLSDKLFKAYAQQIKDMETNTENNQNKLLKVLNELFISRMNEKNERDITINPDLNYRKLERLSETTRELLLNLFGTCEKDYKKGIRIYQQIVDLKLVNIIPAKRENLKEKINLLMSSDYILDDPQAVQAKEMAAQAKIIADAQAKTKANADAAAIAYANAPKQCKSNMVNTNIDSKNVNCINEMIKPEIQEKLSPINNTSCSDKANEKMKEMLAVCQAKIKVAYDFDGVIHMNVEKTNDEGQRYATDNNPNNFIRKSFMKIIQKIKDYHTSGIYEQFILSSRADKSIIIETLRKLNISENIIPDVNILFAKYNEKWLIIRQKEINEFYDDSCSVIVSVQEKRLTNDLPYLNNLYLVFPEKLEWNEIDKNQRLDLNTCISLGKEKKLMFKTKEDTEREKRNELGQNVKNIMMRYRDKTREKDLYLQARENQD